MHVTPQYVVAFKYPFKVSHGYRMNRFDLILVFQIVRPIEILYVDGEIKWYKIGIQYLAQY